MHTHDESRRPCPGCGALFPPSDGATHAYIGASAGCWALYSAVAAGVPPDQMLLQQSEAPPARMELPAGSPAPGPLAPLIVDAYAAQHHGVPSPQATQSVAVHLLVLHGVFSRRLDPSRALWVRRRALRRRGAFSWLAPPRLGAALTLRHLFPGVEGVPARTPAEYVYSVHQAWAVCHDATLAGWYEDVVLHD